MISVDKWHEASDIIDFETFDEIALTKILNDSPHEQASIFNDHLEMRRMREVKIDASSEKPFRVQISHRDEGLNTLLQKPRNRT